MKINSEKDNEKALKLISELIEDYDKILLILINFGLKLKLMKQMRLN
jgi:hypothetical protein